ncbi:MAG: type II secretion system F family protein [Planctomycetota bacterium]
MNDAHHEPTPVTLEYVEPATVRAESGSERSVIAEIGVRLLWFGAGVGVLFGLVYGPPVLLGVSGLGLATIFMVSGPLLLLAAVMLASNLSRLRQRRIDAILGHIAMAVRLNLPIPQMLRAAAQGETSTRRRQLTTAAEAITAGVPIGHAVHRTTPHLDGETAARLDAAERNGTLAAALARIHHTTNDQPASVDPNARMLAVYATVVVVFTLIITAALMIFVIPRYEELFADFGTELPAITKSMLAASRFVVDSYGWVLFLPLLLILPWITGQTLREIRSSEPRRALFLPMFKWVAWRLPLVGRAWKARQWSAVLDATADGIELGRPAAEALQIAAAPGIAGPLRVRVNQMAGALRRGQPWSAAASQAGIGGRMAQFLGSAEQTQSLAATCRFLARTFAATHHRLAHLAAALLTPAVTLLLATLIGWIALAMFLPLIDLADTVMNMEGMP